MSNAAHDPEQWATEMPKLGKKLWQEDDVNYPDKEGVSQAYKRLFGEDLGGERDKVEIADLGDVFYHRTPRCIIETSYDGCAIYELPEAKQDTPEAPAAFRELLKEFVALEHERREHEDRLKIIGERVGQIVPTLLDQFADAGIQNANVDGLTVYVRVDRYVSKRGDVSTEQVCAALRECGLAYMISDGYNAQSLKSKVKEYIDEGCEVPERLAALLNIGEIPRLATRKA